MRYAVLGGIVLVACSSDARESDAGVDATVDVVRMDSGGIGSPCSTTGMCDAGLVCIESACSMPRGVGEACSAEEHCEAGLGCVGLTCQTVGGLDQPCRGDGTCDTDLICDEDVCRQAVQVRLCHCIYTSETMSPVDVEMSVGETLVGPIGPDICSPCTAIPVGMDYPIEIRRTENGAILQTGSLDLTGEIPILGIIFSAGVFEAQVVTCEPTTGFCG